MQGLRAVSAFDLFCLSTLACSQAEAPSDDDAADDEDDGGGHNWGDGKERPDEDADAAQEPRNRKELHEYYAGQGPAYMVLSLLRQNLLRGQCLLIPALAAPLECMYTQDLKLMSQETGAQQLFAAKRAGMTHHSLKTALEILDVMQNDRLMDRLGVPPPAHGGYVDDEPPWRQHEAVTFAHEFGCALASELLWITLTSTSASRSVPQST